MSGYSELAARMYNFWECLAPPEGRDSWFDIRFCACGDSRCRGKLSCFPRSTLADAVSRAASA